MQRGQVGPRLPEVLHCCIGAAGPASAATGAAPASSAPISGTGAAAFSRGNATQIRMRTFIQRAYGIFNLLFVHRFYSKSEFGVKLSDISRTSE